MRATFDTSLGISKAGRVASRPYWHLDLNAGSGFNEEWGCEGSPLQFLRAAQDAAREGEVNSFFNDASPGRVVELRHRCFPLVEGADCLSATYWQADAAVALALFADQIRHAGDRPCYAMGTLLSDPNGPTQGFPLVELVEFAAEFPRIDLILHLDLNVFRAGLRLVANGKWSPRVWCHPIDQIMEMLARNQWFVRNPNSGRSHHFTTIVGRTREIGRTAFKGFFDSRSSEGQRILRDMKRIEPSQKTLFPGMD